MTLFALLFQPLADTLGWTERIVDHLLVGPVLPATFLFGFVVTFAVITLLGALGSSDHGMDSPDAGADLDAGLELDAGGELGGELGTGEIHLEGDIGSDIGGDLGGDLGGDIGGTADVDVAGHGDAAGHVAAAGQGEIVPAGKFSIGDQGLHGGGKDLAVGDHAAETGAHHQHTGVLGGAAAATMRLLHLDRVPLMLWMTILSVVFWVISYVLWFEFDSRLFEPSWLPSILLTFRNILIGLVLTALLTKPLHSLLVPPKHYHARTLVGGVGVVETAQVDANFGRVRFSTNAAPLLLNVRTAGEPIPKHAKVRLIRFYPSENYYLVEAEELYS